MEHCTNVILDGRRKLYLKGEVNCWIKLLGGVYVGECRPGCNYDLIGRSVVSCMAKLSDIRVLMQHSIGMQSNITALFIMDSQHWALRKSNGQNKYLNVQ